GLAEGPGDEPGQLGRPLLPPDARRARGAATQRVPQAALAARKVPAQPLPAPALLDQVCDALPPTHHGEADGQRPQPDLQLILNRLQYVRVPLSRAAVEWLHQEAMPGPISLLYASSTCRGNRVSSELTGLRSNVSATQCKGGRCKWKVKCGV